MYKRNSEGWLKHLDFIILDALILQVAFIVGYSVRMGSHLPYVSSSYRIIAIVYVLVDFLIAAFFNTMHNVMSRGYYREGVQSVKHVLLVVGVMSMYMFTTKSGGEFSRITIAVTTGFHLVLGYLTRLEWKKIVRAVKKDRPKSAVILVAHENDIEKVVSKLSPADSIEYTGLVLTNRNGTGEEICGIPVVASLETAADYICRMWVDEVFVYPTVYADIQNEETEFYKNVEGVINDGFGVFAKKIYDSPKESGDGEVTVATLVEQCRQMAIAVHICLPVFNINSKSFIEKVGGYNVLTSTANYASHLQAAIKRTADIIGGIVGSLIAILVIIVFGPIIKIKSPGPILFKQTRIGKNGKRFKIYKIRTMDIDAEARKKELMGSNRVSDGMMFKMDFDPRIIGNRIVNGKQKTGIGEFLRKGSFDEWPQFFNILLGQMSIVGTRPPTEDEWAKYKYHHRARLAIKPGLTGMWQVSGRSQITDFEEVVKLDAEYINHWSVGLDIRILFKTIQVVFKRKGAM